MSPHFDEAASKTEVTCPYCHSTNTEFFSLFGQQLLTVQYYCNACHTPFEHIKDDDVLDEVGVAHIAPVREEETGGRKKRPAGL
jgi:DNA-directed RNA polymerase subunit RPC12/RpoP